jgi:hypothetical protein
MQEETVAGNDRRAAPRLIVSMSLLLASSASCSQNLPRVHQPKDTRVKIGLAIGGSLNLLAVLSPSKC